MSFLAGTARWMRVLFIKMENTLSVWEDHEFDFGH